MLAVISINILVFTTIGCVLSLLLMIADYFLANYGDCEINVNNGKKKFVVKGGNSLLSSLSENNIFIPSACGGKGTCGLCKVKIINFSTPILPTEKPYLDEEERKIGVRLSCQIKVKKDISIVIPESLFSIRKFTGLIDKIIDYTYDIKGIFIKLTDPNEIEFKAGQYIQLESRKYPKAKQKVIRAYSMASVPSEKNIIELIIRKVPDGIMTTYVHNYLSEADELKLTGPYGDFYIRDGDSDMIFVAGGSGMAPFKSILEDLKQKNCTRRIIYFFGARAEEDLFLIDEMQQYEKTLKNFKYIPVLSQPEKSPTWKGLTGYIPPLIEKYLEKPDNTEGYLCGSPGLIAATEKTMKQLGIKNIYYDSFG